MVNQVVGWLMVYIKVVLCYLGCLIRYINILLRKPVSGCDCARIMTGVVPDLPYADDFFLLYLRNNCKE